MDTSVTIIPGVQFFFFPEPLVTPSTCECVFFNALGTHGFPATQ